MRLKNWLKFGYAFVSTQNNPMKLSFPTAVLLMLAFLSFNATSVSSQDKADKDGIKWTSLEQVEKLNANKKTQRKVFVDVYTDWCGWCKRLDATTYKDPELVKYLNSNFYSVKLNAESKDTISFKGTKHAFNPARRSNSVAAYFMPPSGGGYPTLTYLDNDLKVVRIAPGYVTKDEMLKQLKYINENYYLNMSYEKYVAQASAPAAK